MMVAVMARHFPMPTDPAQECTTSKGDGHPDHSGGEEKQPELKKKIWL
jgi:hypothetical protein